jgi:hypothetical protein
MSVIIPLRRPAAASDAVPPRGGVNIPFQLGFKAGSQHDKDQAVLRAVAAAVALSHPAESLTVARAAQAEGEDPGKRFAAINPQDRRAVLDEVMRVQQNRAAAPSITEDHRVAAQAVGADPLLVAAAHAKLQGNAANGLAAREWAAVLDPALLERAARTAARRVSLGTQKVAAVDLENLDKKIDKGLKELGDKVTAIDARLVEVEPKRR